MRKGCERSSNNLAVNSISEGIHEYELLHFLANPGHSYTRKSCEDGTCKRCVLCALCVFAEVPAMSYRTYRTIEGDSTYRNESTNALKILMCLRPRLVPVAMCSNNPESTPPSRNTGVHCEPEAGKHTPKL